MIDKATEQKIKDVADIVDVVSDYVHLVRRGANYMGLCPFHNERTPSFSVNKAKNFCYCFSCHKGGSPVNFIMQKEGVSYHDALLHLANKYGIKVEERELSPEEREKQTRREAMLLANEWAMKFMEEDLTGTDEGRDVGLAYLYNRGVTQEAIRQFHLGYALDDGQHLLSAARSKGFDIDIFKELGLVGTSQRGTDYDRFHGRVIFPILNSSGKVIAFGARDLKGGPAKYMNSPESSLYKKSNELYGMYQARTAIVKEDKCILVEGYLDVIGMWQSGMQNVVASSGTALTDGQISLIHRFTGNVTLIYDGDAAGIKASLRGIDMLLSHGMDVKVLLLPDGHDPDSFARANTPEQFREYIASHETDIIRFKAKILMEHAKGDPAARASAVQSVIESIACISNKVKRDIYVQECSRLMGVSEDSISLQIQRVRPKVVEDLRKARERESVDLIPPGPSAAVSPAPVPADMTVPANIPDNSRNLTPTVADINRQRAVRAATNAANPMAPLEREVIKYAVRYGLTDFCESSDNSGNVVLLSVVEYINEELELDNISFSVTEYGKVFSRILAMVSDFRNLSSLHAADIDARIEKKRKEGYDEIAMRGLDMQQITIEEKRLESILEAEKEAMMAEFARDYPSTQLASDSDDDVRATVTELITDRHELSNIYLRQGNVVSEEENLMALLPRAITEWKTELLEIQLKDLMKRLRDSAGQTEEEVMDLQQEIAKIILLRREVAKNIGERILAPRRK